VVGGGGSAGCKVALYVLFKLGEIHFVMSLTWEPLGPFHWWGWYSPTAWWESRYRPCGQGRAAEL